MLWGMLTYKCHHRWDDSLLLHSNWMSVHAWSEVWMRNWNRNSRSAGWYTTVRERETKEQSFLKPRTELYEVFLCMQEEGYILLKIAKIWMKYGLQYSQYRLKNIIATSLFLRWNAVWPTAVLAMAITGPQDLWQVDYLVKGRLYFLRINAVRNGQYCRVPSSIKPNYVSSIVASKSIIK